MNETRPLSERRQYLIDGRRVRIKDLIDARLIEPGTELQFDRPRIAESHIATVLADGRLRLSDGRIYSSPSRAAGAAIRGSVDGWYAWRTKSTSELLATLRRKLLEEAGQEGGRDVKGNSPTTLERHDFLRRARESSASGHPTETTVRDLIALWDARSRGQVLSERIENDLDNHGLVTDPHFRKVGLDSRITIREHASDPEIITETTPRRRRPIPATTQAAGQIAESPDSQTEVGITLGNIPSANTDVAKVKPGATYNEAITTMLLNDYSQLAVMSSPRRLEGAVTWQSIAREQNARSESRLSDAIIPAPVFSFDTELIDILPTLQSKDFVFVKGRTGCITGIVTAADVVQAYGQMATPFFLIGELDQLLRRVVADNFEIETIQPLCDEDGKRKLISHDQLTMGDYERVLQNEANWNALQWPLDRRVFTKRLALLREARNDIMHFNPDPIPDEIVGQLRTMVQIIKRFT